MSESKSLLNPTKVMAVDDRRAEALIELGEVDPDYLAYYNKLSPKRKERIHRQVAKTKTGLHTVAPTICVGPSKCMFIEQCPIPERGDSGEIILGDTRDYPMYRPCVFEMLFMQQKVIDYMRHLNVDPENPIEVALVNDLAVIDLYKNRALLIMSAGDKEGDGRDFMKRDVMEQQGEHGTLMSTQTQLHPAAVYLDTLEKRRSRLIEALNETRKAKLDVSIKLGQGKVDSALRQDLVAIRKALEAVTGDRTALVKKEEVLLIDDD